MEKRCLLGLFSFAIFLAFDPAFAAQVETITESGKPLIRKSSGGRPFPVHSTALSDRQLSATSRLARQYPWKTSIVTTVFWIGEQPTGNNPVPIAPAPGTNNGQEATAVLTTQILLTGVITFPSNSNHGRTHFTAPFPTTIRHALVIGPKRRTLCRGSRRHTRARPFPPVKIVGSRSAKAIERSMPNGKTPDLSGPITGNMCLATNGQNLTSIKAPDSMSRQPCATISD